MYLPTGSITAPGSCWPRGSSNPWLLTSIGIECRWILPGRRTKPLLLLLEVPFASRWRQSHESLAQASHTMTMSSAARIARRYHAHLSRYWKNFCIHWFMILWFDQRRTSSFSRNSPCWPPSALTTVPFRYCNISAGHDASVHKRMHVSDARYQCR